MNFYLSSLDLRKGIIRSVIAVLLGVIFLIAPDLLPNTLVIILGATILFVGIVSFLTIFTKDGGKPVGINYFNLALSLIVGIVLLLFPDSGGLRTICPCTSATAVRASPSFRSPSCCRQAHRISYPSAFPA